MNNTTDGAAAIRTPITSVPWAENVTSVPWAENVTSVPWAENVTSLQRTENDTSIHWTEDRMSLETRAAILLWKVWPPCLLVVGSFGNVATFFVMRRIKDHNSSQHFILMALAVSDFTLLYVSTLRQWLFYLFHVDMYDLHTVVCKLCWWLIYVSASCSSWLLTCVTVQRTMAVKWPHRMRAVCSLSRTRTIIGAVVSFAFVLHVHFLPGMVISRGKCTHSSEPYRDFVAIIWGWVDLTTLTVIPSACLLTCDVILSLTLFKASSSASMVSVHTATSAAKSTGDAVHISRRKTASRTTVMILAVSCTFLVLTLPVCVYLISDYYLYSHVPHGVRLWTRQGLYFAVAMLLWYTNSAVNFLLYCFTGTKFRTEFLQWICCRSGHPHPAPSTMDSSSLSMSSSGWRSKQQ